MDPPGNESPQNYFDTVKPNLLGTTRLEMASIYQEAGTSTSQAFANMFSLFWFRSRCLVTNHM